MDNNNIYTLIDEQTSKKLALIVGLPLLKSLHCFLFVWNYDNSLFIKWRSVLKSKLITQKFYPSHSSTYQSFLFCFSDFIILPGFIDFSAEEVVS